MQLWLAVIHLLLVERQGLVVHPVLVLHLVLVEIPLCPVADRVLVVALLWLVAVLAALHQQTLREAHRILPESVV
jgi:hypothetical protein